MRRNTARPVHSWMTFEGSTAAQAIEKYLEHAIGFTEHHNHWHGMLDPQAYIKALLPCQGEGGSQAGAQTVKVRDIQLQFDLILTKTARVPTCCAERNAAAQQLVLQYHAIHGVEEQVDGFKDAMLWLADASTEPDRSERILHVLGSRDKSGLHPINWDWAYTFRRLLRRQADTHAESCLAELRCSTWSIVASAAAAICRQIMW